VHYTVSKQLERSALEKEAVPGSLEENLQAPEDYLDLQYDYYSKSRQVLNPLNVYDKLSVQRALSQLMGNEDKKKVKVRRRTFIRDGDIDETQDTKKQHELIKEVHNSLIIKLYQNASNKIGCGSCKKSEDKQERAFKRHNVYQKKCERSVREICNTIGRRPFESIIEHSRHYRERIEKAKDRETPLETKAWYLELRNFNDIRQHMLPLGNTMNGLWMRMLNNTRQEIIRTPEVGNYKSIGIETLIVFLCINY
jgi:hypothetical protein